MEIDKTIVFVECENRNHNGLSLVMEGARLPNSHIGQDAAFLAFLLGNFEATVESLHEENSRLREAIVKHRAAQGHDMCHENDTELYAILDDGVEVNHAPPPRCEFRQKCREYYESRPGAEKKDDGW